MHNAAVIIHSAIVVAISSCQLSELVIGLVSSRQRQVSVSVVTGMVMEDTKGVEDFMRDGAELKQID